MKPIRIELRNTGGTLSIELSLTPSQYRSLFRYAERRGHAYPPCGLLDMNNADRIASALEYAWPLTDQPGRREIVRLRDGIATANNARELSLSLVVTRGFELNLGPVHLGRRTQVRERITPDGVLHKETASG